MSVEIIQSETLYEGRVFSIQRQKLRLNNGREFTCEIVAHSGAVTIVPIDPQGRMLFVRQYRYGAGVDLLELPAGTLEPDEAPDVSAAREVREEVGLAAGSLEKLGEFYLAPGYSSEYMHVYLATGLYAAPLPGDEDEDIEIVAIPAAEAFAMAERGEIRDGKTLAALFLARTRLTQ